MTPPPPISTRTSPLFPHPTPFRSPSCPERRDPDLRRGLGLADDTRLMIFAGRGSREKNLHVLLETARQLGKPYHLLLVGSSMPQRVPDNVTVIDRFCCASEVARSMARSDVLLHAGNP